MTSENNPYQPSEAAPVASVLTAETLRDAIERLVTAPPVYCGSPERPHVVHPKATGLTNCANCFRVVDVSTQGEPRG